MGRALRVDVGDHVYHILNRANAHGKLFTKKSDYALFESVLTEAKERFDMRIMAYCIMPNHWHLVLYPHADGDLAKFMSWLTLTHTQRWHAYHDTVGNGHLYQGRYKSFLCENDAHFLTVVRYVERNPKRANLVRKAEEWQWGSAWHRHIGSSEQQKLLDEWPVPMPRDYFSFLNEPQTAAELESIRTAVQRGSPFGSTGWVGTSYVPVKSRAASNTRRFLRSATAMRRIFRARIQSIAL